MNMTSISTEDNGHDGPADWPHRPYTNDLHSIKRENVQLRKLYDQSHRELKLCRDEQALAQQQVSQLRNEMHDLQIHSRKLDAENTLYKQALDNQHDDEGNMSATDSREMLSKMYDTAIERINSLTNELGRLKGLYDETARQNSVINEQYMSKCEELKKDRSEMQSLRAQCTAAIHKWSSIFQENHKLEDANIALKLQLDEMGKEHSNKDKDLSMMGREKEEQLKEYKELLKNHELVMSERENVLKKLDSLEDRLSETRNKLADETNMNKQLEARLVAYRSETQSFLNDRDRARQDLHELRDMVQMFTQNGDHSKIEDYLRSKKPEITKERNEVTEELLSRGNRLPTQPFDMKGATSEGNVSKEVELLRKEIAALQKEVAEEREQAGENKNRRDWAFNERDKIVLERESIRRQCDELRRERDRAVSNHAEVLRELDELKKFKQNSTKELKDVKEQLEKQERTNQLIRQSNSRDSAIDNDFQDWDIDQFTYDIDVPGCDTDLGITIESGGSDASDSTLYVNSIAKGSPCEGRLRVNDVLLKVNDVEVAFASKDTVLKAIHAAHTAVTLVVKRKKHVGRFNVNVRLDLAKKDPGLQLETGVYISKITCGSLSAKEGNIAVGDRVLSVNDKSVEHKTAKEVMKMIQSNSDVVLSVGKYGGLSPDANLDHNGLHHPHKLFDKFKDMMKVTSDSDRDRDRDRNIHKSPSVDDNTGSARKSKRGPKELRQMVKGFFRKRPYVEEDDYDTIRMRDAFQDLDAVLASTPTGTFTGDTGVDVSTNGTVTVKSSHGQRGTIPSQFIDTEKVYHSQQQPSTNNSVQQELDRKPDHSTRVNMEGHMRTPITQPSQRLRQPMGDAAKTCTLPNTSGSRYHTPLDVLEKSRSLEGHTGRYGRQTIDPQMYPLTSKTNYQHGKNSEEALVLDEAVENYYISYQSRKDSQPHKNSARSFRPNSLHTGNNRAISPNDSRPAPPSPHRRPRAGPGPESPSPITPYHPGSRPHSAAGQPYPGKHNGQVFFSSKPHTVMYPTHTSPYVHLESRMHEYPPTRESTASPVPSYQSQTLDSRRYHGHRGDHGTGRATSTEYPTTRVKFPSNTSVSSATRRSINSNSLEVVSGRCSPMSPTTSEFHRHSEESINRNRPKEGVLRVIELDTSTGIVNLGIRINEVDSGIFVSAVSQNSLAENVGIHVGDEIVEFCGINMRTASYDMARRVLMEWRSGDAKARMRVQYNPNKCKSFPDQDSDVDRNSVTGSIQTIHTHKSDNGTLNRKLYVLHSNCSSSDDSRLDPPRSICIQKTSSHAGIRLCGGNATGVFVGELHDHSPAAMSGLQVGDHLLEINGKNVDGATAEQAAIELNRPVDTLNLVVQYNLNRFSTTHAGGDHFYVKSLFSYEAEHKDSRDELSLNIGDLLLVENSLVNGQIGKWYVKKVNEHGQEIQSGIVPSRMKLEENWSLRRSLSEVLHDEDGKSSKRNGSMGRRSSFFKRRSGRHQHQRSSSRDSRELTSFSDLSVSSDNVPITDDGKPLLYQRVDQKDCKSMRPVVILGPFANALVQKLVNESPDKWTAYDGTFMNTSTSEIEKGIADGTFVDYLKDNDLFKVFRTDDLHNIAAMHKHCLLLVNPAAVERMLRRDLYPIVIYIKHKSLKQVREVEDPRFLPKRLSSRSAKDLFEHFQKVEVEYKNVFTVEVQGANMAAMSQNIKKAVDTEQRKKIWVPHAIMA